MKRYISLITCILILIGLCACNTQTPAASPSGETSPSAGTENNAQTRVAALKGATAIGMAGLWKEEEAQPYTIHYVTTDEVVPMLAKGEVDLAALPANLAATLYNNTDGSIQVLAINTLGLSYIVETGTEIQSVSDLRGKTILAQGKGTVLEYTLRHILKQNGLDPDNDVTLEFKSEPTEVVAALTQQGGIAMLSQPFVTTAMDNVEGLREALDLTAEWDKLDNSGTFITGVLVGRTEYIEANPEAVEAFLGAYEASVEWVDGNPAEAAPLLEGIVPGGTTVLERAIPKCHITFVGGEGMKTMLAAYLGVLFESEPASIGGALPGDDFYAVFP